MHLHCLQFNVSANMSVKHSQHHVTCLTETFSALWLWIPYPCPLPAKGSNKLSGDVLKGLRISLLYESIFWRRKTCACDLTPCTHQEQHISLLLQTGAVGSQPLLSWILPPLSQDIWVLHQLLPWLLLSIISPQLSFAT